MTVQTFRTRAGDVLRGGILVLLVFSATGLASASDETEVTPEFRAAVERLMEVTKVEESTRKAADLMAVQMAQLTGEEDPEDTAQMQEVVSGLIDVMTAEGGPMQQMIPVYAKYFTHDDILQMIAFYETPLGQKTIKVMPQIAGESAQVTMRWITGVFQELQEEDKEDDGEMQVKGRPTKENAVE